MVMLRMARLIAARAVTVAAHFSDRGVERNSLTSSTRPIPDLNMAAFLEPGDTYLRLKQGLGALMSSWLEKKQQKHLHPGCTIHCALHKRHKDGFHRTTFRFKHRQIACLRYRTAIGDL